MEREFRGWFDALSRGVGKDIFSVEFRMRVYCMYRK